MLMKQKTLFSYEHWVCQGLEKEFEFRVRKSVLNYFAILIFVVRQEKNNESFVLSFGVLING